MFNQASYNAWKNKRPLNDEELEKIVNWLLVNENVKQIKVYDHDRVLAIREKLFQEKILERKLIKDKESKHLRYGILKDYTLLVAAIKQAKELI